MTSEFPPRIYRVRDGRVLHFPEGILNGDTGRVWVMSGGVVDLGDPLVAELADGQRYKLLDEPAAKPTWTEDSAPLAIRRHLEVERAKRRLAKVNSGGGEASTSKPTTEDEAPRVETTRRRRRRSTTPVPKEPDEPVVEEPARSRASDVADAIERGGGL